MRILNCKLIVNSNARHLQPILSGFNILRRSKVIELEQHFPGSSFILRGKTIAVEELFVNEMHLDVVIDSSILVHYDVSDSKNINEEALAACDVYFKRSYCSEFICTNYQDSRDKIKPLGLYFLALGNDLDLYSVKRDLEFSRVYDKFKSLVKQFDRGNFLTYSPYLKFFEQAPILSKKPKILFFAKVWDPESDGEYKLTPEDAEDRVKINQSRVECIRALKRRYGSNFSGGIEATDFSNRYCKDLVITNSEITKRSNYIKLMQQHDVCIATAGLHQSTGGKFAEYIASSRSIVSEPLAYKPIGPIEPGQHYLEFKSVDECVFSVDKLMKNSKFRRNMMMNNFKYYQNFVRPECQVKHSLLTAVECYYNKP